MPRSGKWTRVLSAPGQALGSAAALAEIGSATRNRAEVDARRTTTAEISGQISAQGGATMKVKGQGSTDGGSNWVDIASMDITATGMRSSGNVSFPAALRNANLLLRHVTIDGDGVTAAVSGWIHLEGNPAK